MYVPKGKVKKVFSKAKRNTSRYETLLDPNPTGSTPIAEYSLIPVIAEKLEDCKSGERWNNNTHEAVEV